MEAVLTSVLGIVPLKDKILTIGRSPNNGLFVNNSTVSRHHAEVRLLGRNYSIVDLGSTTGTFVNGERIIPRMPHLLHSGDTIQVGSFPLAYDDQRPFIVNYTPLPQSVSEPSSSAQSQPETTTRVADSAAMQFVLRNANAVPDVLVSVNVASAMDQPGISQASGTDLVSSAAELAPLKGLAGPAGVSVTPALSLSDKTYEKSVHLVGEHLQFTAFYPRAVQGDSWHTLLVYTHVAADLKAVRADMSQLKERLDAETDGKNDQSACGLTEGTQITVMPVFQGITFQPERISFTWSGAWHPTTFRFSADPRWTGAIGTGEVMLLVGPLVVASLRIPLRFVEADAGLEQEYEEVSVARYKNIFTSYSHDDEAMIQAIRQAYEAIDDESFQDIEILRADQNWHSILSRAIDSADVFQLFWSPNAAQSQCVYQECQYALQHYKYDGFIRPIYWEKPLKSAPPEFSHLHFTYYEFLS